MASSEARDESGNMSNNVVAANVKDSSEGSRWAGFEDLELLQLREAMREQSKVAVVRAMTCEEGERDTAAVFTGSMLALELDLSGELHTRGVDLAPELTLTDIATLAEAIRRGEAKPSKLAESLAEAA